MDPRGQGEAPVTATTSEAPAMPAMVTVPPKPAEEAGLVARVLVDEVVWDDCIAWTEADTARKGIALDEATRRADVLYLAACVLKRDSPRGSGAGRPGALAFTVERVPRATTGREAERVTLAVTAGRSPHGTVIVTIGPAPVAPGPGGAR